MMRERETEGMTFIVKTVTRLTLGFILLYGIYIGLSGHLSPGGGFAGGVIVALSFIHIMLAFGKKVALKRMRSNLLRVVVSAAAIAFLFIVMMNVTFKRAPLFSSEVLIPVCEMVVVGAGLFAIFIALVFLTKTDKDSV
jgi:multicomponent Na+:H+ antiporter subunit B